jgi:hypothetical protein
MKLFARGILTRLWAAGTFVLAQAQTPDIGTSDQALGITGLQS